MLVMGWEVGGNGGKAGVWSYERYSDLLLTRLKASNGLAAGSNHAVILSGMLFII